jgi:hypothetical protein
MPPYNFEGAAIQGFSSSRDYAHSPASMPAEQRNADLRLVFESKENKGDVTWQA